MLPAGRPQTPGRCSISVAMSSRAHIIVGLSGGVDSAVAALLLLEQGHRVEGLFMRNWEDDDTDTYCSAEADLADARSVCAELGIPLHQVNFAAEYKARVFQHCLAEFRAGRTPNPDVLCNRHIKFRAFLDHARRLGATRVATGHYAGAARRHGAVQLLKAADPGKDQTYFLHLLDQSQLAAACFPLAGLRKSEVRRRAEDAGFLNCDKKDSTGICFVGERDFTEFLSRYIESTPGEIRSTGGHYLGQHRGLPFYTIGQRRGLAIGGRSGDPGQPWYVVAKDLARNTLVVGQGHDHPALLSAALETEPASWIAGAAPGLPMDCTARLRHRQPEQRCRVHALAGGRLRVEFHHAQRAVTPGQSVVFYREDTCLGGAQVRQALAMIDGEPQLDVG